MNFPEVLDDIFLMELHQFYMNDGRLSINCLKQLLEKVQKILRNEPNVITIDETTLIFGDYHGQYFDFIFQRDDPFWKEKEHVSLYLGDYVDRGVMSCEIITTLFFMKLIHPKKTILLRGNHESRAMTNRFGFKAECIRKYSIEIYNLFMETFDCLPLVAIVKSEIGDFFCSHGGISPNLLNVNDIDQIDRFCEIPSSGLFTDLLWSDPFCIDDQVNFGFVNAEKIMYFPNIYRGISYIYGINAVKYFLQSNNLVAMVRAHQCYDGGVEIHNFACHNAPPLCFTVFGASNYKRNNFGGCIMIGGEALQTRRYECSGLEEEFHYDKTRIFVDSIVDVGIYMQYLAEDFILWESEQQESEDTEDEENEEEEYKTTISQMSHSTMEHEFQEVQNKLLHSYQIGPGNQNEDNAKTMNSMLPLIKKMSTIIDCYTHETSAEDKIEELDENKNMMNEIQTNQSDDSIESENTESNEEMSDDFDIPSPDILPQDKRKSLLSKAYKLEEIKGSMKMQEQKKKVSNRRKLRVRRPMKFSVSPGKNIMVLDSMFLSNDEFSSKLSSSSSNVPFSFPLFNSVSSEIPTKYEYKHRYEKFEVAPNCLKQEKKTGMY